MEYIHPLMTDAEERRLRSKMMDEGEHIGFDLAFVDGLGVVRDGHAVRTNLFMRDAASASTRSRGFFVVQGERNN